MPDTLERAISRFCPGPDEGAETVHSRVTAAAFRAAVEQRLVLAASETGPATLQLNFYVDPVEGHDDYLVSMALAAGRPGSY